MWILGKKKKTKSEMSWGDLRLSYTFQYEEVEKGVGGVVQHGVGGRVGRSVGGSALRWGVWCNRQ